MTGASLELTFNLAGGNAFIRCWPRANRNILDLANFSQCPCSGSLGVLFSDPCCSVRTLFLLICICLQLPGYLAWLLGMCWNRLRLVAKCIRMGHLVLGAHVVRLLVIIEEY